MHWEAHQFTSDTLLLYFSRWLAFAVASRGVSFGYFIASTVQVRSASDHDAWRRPLPARCKTWLGARGA